MRTYNNSDDDVPIMHIEQIIIDSDIIKEYTINSNFFIKNSFTMVTFNITNDIILGIANCYIKLLEKCLMEVYPSEININNKIRNNRFISLDINTLKRICVSKNIKLNYQ